MSVDDDIWQSAKKAALKAAEAKKSAQNNEKKALDDKEAAIAISAVAVAAGNGFKNADEAIEVTLNNAGEKTVIAEAHFAVSEAAKAEAQTKEELATIMSIAKESREEAHEYSDGISSNLADIAETLTEAKTVEVNAAEAEREFAENVAEVLEKTSNQTEN